MTKAASELNSIIGSELDSDADQFLTFILGEEEYGVDILRVQEIKGWDSVTPIPNTPDYIKGVINLRGTIVPIVDLRQRFNMPEIEYGPITVVIVLKIECADRDRIMGIVVDGVSDVYDVPQEEMKEPPDFGNVVDTEFVRGLATVEEKMIIILDIDHLLSGSEIKATDGLAD
ncbi:MAG: chemotaxis protein CheW [Sulfuriflexus sp.]|nr:chemotaxis protein CheW [Sulfuriflexus sp.]